VAERMGAAAYAVTDAERRILTALAGAAIDPGELLWRELVVRVRPTPMHVVGDVARMLQRRGLVDCEGENLDDAVRLTRAGADLVDRLGIAWAVRT
jgi:predicted methyltransferase